MNKVTHSYEDSLTLIGFKVDVSTYGTNHQNRTNRQEDLENSTSPECSPQFKGDPLFKGSHYTSEHPLKRRYA